MPIYEYYCPQCQTEFELMRPVSQVGKLAPCPSCGREGRKLVSACASKVGFYIRPPAKTAFRQRPEMSSTS
jgi:putative FmdB family regulatory protein